MIYIGDGLTDVLCMKLVKANGGYSIAVFQQKKKGKVEALLIDNRVNYIEKVDYAKGGALEATVEDIIRKMTIEEKLIRKNATQIRQIKKD